MYTTNQFIKVYRSTLNDERLKSLAFITRNTYLDNEITARKVADYIKRTYRVPEVLAIDVANTYVKYEI